MIPVCPAAVAEPLRRRAPGRLDAFGDQAPRRRRPTARAHRRSAKPEALRPRGARAAPAWRYCFDFLDESHQISQEDGGNPDRGCWHAIMHRREPDAANSKYWWRRVGKHPVLDQLRDRAPEVGFAFTTPEAFVDVCERVRDTGNAEEAVAKRVQQLEWDLLFAWCYAP